MANYISALTQFVGNLQFHKKYEQKTKTVFCS